MLISHVKFDRGGSRRGSLGGGAHTLVGGSTVILGLFLVFVKPIFKRSRGARAPSPPPSSPGSTPVWLGACNQIYL